MAAKPLPCRLGFHKWSEQRADAGGAARLCARCGRRQAPDPGDDRRPPTAAERSQEFRESLSLLATVVLAVAAVGSLAFVAQFDLDTAISVLGAALLTLGAAACIGGLLGFLFGIPKTFQSDSAPPKADGSESGETRYLVNTNLEQISDWLTKILVGVGLVQISSAPEQLARLADAMAPMFGGVASSPAFGLAVALYGAVASFIISYLWTRALLRGVLQAADVDIDVRIEGVVTAREDANARSVALVEKQLAGEKAPAQADLTAALKEASPAWLIQLYRRAEDQRLRSWRTDKARMALTIPIFQALIANDPDRRYFRHFGSLGYALKDQENPDYREALANLSIAIEVRGPLQSSGWPFYEWNRAVCRIRLDAAFADGQPTSMPTKGEIVDDLSAARGWLPPEFLSAESGDPDSAMVGRWIALNKVKLH